MLTAIQNTAQPHTVHKLFASFRAFRHVLLITSIGIWMICPLAGIVLLLLYSQINLSSDFLTGNQKRFSNFFPITLVLFTLVTYTSTIEPFSDTITYIDTYKQLAKDQIFSWLDIEFEPLSFILPKYISILTNGNELSFLFFQSLTINLLLTSYSIAFSPEFYPLIILINSITAGYYFQLFWMRQFYSFIFIIPAIYISNFSLVIFLLFIAFYTHNSSLFYFLPLLVKSIVDKTYFIGKFFFKPLKKLLGTRLIILAILLFLLTLLPSFWRLALTFLGNVGLPDNLSSKIDVYSGSKTADFNQDTSNLRSQLRVIIDYATILFFALSANFKAVKPIFYRWLFLFFTLLLGFIGAVLFSFNLRLNALFFCLPGFFYMIPLYSGRMIGQFNIYTGIFLFSIAFRLVYFFYSTSSSNPSGAYLKFWDGNPLFTPITSYFEVFFKFLISLFP
jgi:hypothetical protein